MWLHKIDIYKDEMETAITKSLLMNNVQKKKHKNKGREHILAVVGLEYVRLFIFQELFEQLGHPFVWYSTSQPSSPLHGFNIEYHPTAFALMMKDLAKTISLPPTVAIVAL